MNAPLHLWERTIIASPLGPPLAALLFLSLFLPSPLPPQPRESTLTCVLGIHGTRRISEWELVSSLWENRCWFMRWCKDYPWARCCAAQCSLRLRKWKVVSTSAKRTSLSSTLKRVSCLLLCNLSFPSTHLCFNFLPLTSSDWPQPGSQSWLLCRRRRYPFWQWDQHCPKRGIHFPHSQHLKASILECGLMILSLLYNLSPG